LTAGNGKTVDALKAPKMAEVIRTNVVSELAGDTTMVRSVAIAD